MTYSVYSFLRDFLAARRSDEKLANSRLSGAQIKAIALPSNSLLKRYVGKLAIEWRSQTNWIDDSTVRHFARKGRCAAHKVLWSLTDAEAKFRRRYHTWSDDKDFYIHSGVLGERSWPRRIANEAKGLEKFKQNLIARGANMGYARLDCDNLMEELLVYKTVKQMLESGHTRIMEDSDFGQLAAKVRWPFIKVEKCDFYKKTEDGGRGENIGSGWRILGIDKL